ncbi:MAG: DNA-formamidopyrimidine glycosylase [Candidatus Pacebacteria bacterium]|nr:DNA-formamidopyrimidine glycosylase [Candidatus Paceibacterota bacterium]
MPELPEVETTIKGLKKEVLNRTFVNIWTDAPKLIKRPALEEFKKNIIGRKITGIKRRAKNILFCLDKNFVLLIHQKMSGHLLVGNWEEKNGKWVSKKRGPLLEDKMNKYLHVMFFLSGGKQMALSDLRKFAKIELWNKEALGASKEYKAIGIEPLSPGFTLNKFKDLFKGKKGRIKQVLMDQNFIAGIGNIYASEILLEARVHPETDARKLSPEDLKNIYSSIKKVLKRAIDLGGTSRSDYRNVYGEEGGFQKIAKVYGKEGSKCPLSCGGTVKRLKIGGRSSFYCPNCQRKK